MTGRYWVDKTTKVWTDERIERLAQLWGEGLSASEISECLGGVSRSAVIGKVHRIGLPGRTKKKRKPGPRPTSRTARPQLEYVETGISQHIRDIVRKPHVPRKEVIVVPLGDRVGLADLADDQCRWPIGDPQEDDFHFCNRKQIPGAAYCESHYRVAYEPIDARKRNARRQRHRKPELVRN